ncbi:amidohydrolase [Thalassospira sp. NFXS8]|uniref:amidohydrolase family protein n=1 Tax=Thalassospira sp. NFXS8 TaxID=2819093 RepID=UPI0032E00722
MSLAASVIAPRRIDVHQHVIPPVWAQALGKHGGDPSGWHMPDWSPAQAVEFMDRLHIQTGILSLTAPGVAGWHGQERRDMAARVNDYSAELVSTQPARFGNFITLPLPDIDGTLHEIDRGFDSLAADGVVLLTNYDGEYPGDARFDPIWVALNARKAVVFVHPTKPFGLDVIAGIPAPTLDYPFDTTRLAAQLVFNGVTRRYRDVKIILSHAGGFLPYAAQRFAELATAFRSDITDPATILEEFRRFYFDTALSSSQYALPSLTAFAKPGHILFGSDFPYAPARIGQSFANQLDENTTLSVQTKTAINRDNALSLFPRLTHAK